MEVLNCCPYVDAGIWMSPGFPTLLHSAFAAASLLLTTTLLGWRASDLIFPGCRGARLLAPAVGLAILGAVSVAVCALVGVSTVTVGLTVAALVVAAWLAGRKQPIGRLENAHLGLLLFVVAAAIVAILPTLSILPFPIKNGVFVGAHIFDHVKVVIVDEIVRSGSLPPGNPFFGRFEDHAPIKYYYLLYFIEAELRVLLGVSAWEADIAATWFAATASLLVMGGVATAVSGRATAAWWVLPLCIANTFRIVTLQMKWHFLDGLLAPTHSLETWPEQASWAPQHIAASICVIPAVFVAVRLLRQEAVGIREAFLLGVLAAAAFGFSSWVGGIALAVIMASILLVAGWWPRYELKPRAAAASFALAGIVALGLAAPFLSSQFTLVSQGGLPVEFDRFPALASAGRAGGSWLADLVGYWLVLLPIELPAIFVTGMLALAGGRWIAPHAPTVWLASATTVIAALLVSQFLRASIATNDLGWRAVIPAIILLTAWSAALIDSALRVWRPRRFWLALSIAYLAFVAWQDWASISFNIDVYRLNARKPVADIGGFRDAPRMWQAVRRHAAPDARVLNNPLSLARLTPWPGNMGWALFSDRRSCASGEIWLWAFAPLPRARSHEVMLPVDRLFAGNASEGDVAHVLDELGCQVLVLTQADPAWSTGSWNRIERLVLLEETDAWRIYKARQR